MRYSQGGQRSKNIWNSSLQIDGKCISETLFLTAEAYTTQKKKFSIKDFFSNYDQIWFGHIYWRNP